MRTKLFVTRKIPAAGLDRLLADSRLSVKVYKRDRAIPRDILLKRVKGAHVILSILTDKIDGEVMDASGPQLKMIANYAVGFDNIDVNEAKRRGIIVTNSAHPGVSESVAEHTIALIFALAHRIVETDRFTRAGKYHAWGPQMFLGTDVIGKTLGIIGTGAIGSSVVKRMHDGFGINILYSDIKRNEALEQKTGAKFVTKEELLAQSDFVSIHVPLLPSTRHLISTSELALMKKTAFLINTSRGPIVDEKALLLALSEKRIAGAGLDVYECEPMIDCDPEDNLELRKMWNTVLTPHTASATLETRNAMANVAADNILAFLDKKTPPNAL